MVLFSKHLPLGHTASNPTIFLQKDEFAKIFAVSYCISKKFSGVTGMTWTGDKDTDTNTPSGMEMDTNMETFQLSNCKIKPSMIQFFPSYNEQ